MLRSCDTSAMKKPEPPFYKTFTFWLWIVGGLIRQLSVYYRQRS